jgi:hypothetical protein
VDPVPDPLLLRKFGSAGNRTRDLWTCGQELWPLGHRDGRHYCLRCFESSCGTDSKSEPLYSCGYSLHHGLFLKVLLHCLIEKKNRGNLRIILEYPCLGSELSWPSSEEMVYCWILLGSIFFLFEYYNKNISKQTFRYHSNIWKTRSNTVMKHVSELVLRTPNWRPKLRYAIRVTPS